MTALTSIVLDGLAYGMVLFIISAGLSVTMGLMRVINLAHGAFAMTGGYLAASMVNAGLHFAAAVLIAVLVVAAAGAVLEKIFYAPLYGRSELGQVLMTIGLTFVFIAVLTIVFGTGMMSLPIPAGLTGMVDLGVRDYPTYRTFLIGIGIVLFILLWLLIERTPMGARLRASVDNARMARAMGLDINRLFMGTFALGSGLAAFGGAIGAEVLPLEPFYALKYLVYFLTVVAVGGQGSLTGSFVAAIALGAADTAGKYLFPELGAFFIYAVMIALLLLRPEGLFGRAT